MESTCLKASSTDENKPSVTLEMPSSVKEISCASNENTSAAKDTLDDMNETALDTPLTVNHTSTDTMENSTPGKDELTEANQEISETTLSVKDSSSEAKENTFTSTLNHSLSEVNASALETTSSRKDMVSEGKEITSSLKDVLSEVNALILKTKSPVENTVTDTKEKSPVSRDSVPVLNASVLDTRSPVNDTANGTKENSPNSKDSVLEVNASVLETTSPVKDTVKDTKENTPVSKDPWFKVNVSAVETPSSFKDTSSGAKENCDNSTSTDKWIHEIPKLKCNDIFNFPSKETENSAAPSMNSIFIFKGCENNMHVKSQTTKKHSKAVHRSTKIHSKDSTSLIHSKGCSNAEKHSCDFCHTSAQFVCRFCSFKYCKSCRDQLHPHVGPYQHHAIVHIDEEVGMIHLDICDEHGLPEKLFCDFCKCMKCTECARSTCKLHFKGKVSKVDIETEKTKLLDEYEKASSKMSFLGKYREKLEEEMLSVELKTLLKRDKIRQEFASFHEMLILKENAILEKLDEDMSSRLRYIKESILPCIEKLEKEDGHLTNSVMDLIQCKDDQHFIEEHVVAKERCRNVDRLIQDFDESWSKHSSYAPSYLLDNQLSMLCEKRQLSDSLDVALGHGGVLRFKNAIVRTISDGKPVYIFKYLQVPSSNPPSTELELLVQIYNDGVLLYSQSISNPKMFQLDSLETCNFISGLSYLIKVTSFYKSSTGRESCSKSTEMHTHMLLQ